MNYERKSDSLTRSVSREVRLDDIADLQECLDTSRAIYDTLRTDGQFIVGDTQISKGITHRGSRMTESMRFVVNDTLLNDIDIINPRVHQGDTGIKIVATDRNIPGRHIIFSEMAYGVHPDLDGAFFVDDSMSEYLNTPQRGSVEAVAFSDDIVPWLLSQEGMEPDEIVRVKERESDPVRFAADLLSRRADQIINIEEIHTELDDGLSIAGQRVQQLDPSDPTQPPLVSHYTVWTTAIYNTEKYGKITERTIITFSPHDPLLYMDSSPLTSIKVDIEADTPQSTHVLKELVNQRALGLADGSSNKLLLNLNTIYSAVQELTEVPL